MVEYLNFTAIMVTNIIIILAGIALMPYFISFKATKKPPPDISKAIDTKNYNKK
jgi:hypothetical protein